MIAITGIGLTTALGTTREESWRGLLAGACGVRPLSVFDSEGFRSRVAAEVDMAPIDATMTPLERRRRRAQLCFATRHLPWLLVKGPILSVPRPGGAGRGGAGRR